MTDRRDLIVVDVETSGLNTTYHWPLEIAAVNVRTKEELYFVPFLEAGVLDGADGDALRLNRYFERGVYQRRLSKPDSAQVWQQLWKMLKGNTLGGSNPTFDAAMLRHGFPYDEPPPWHHRLADLAAFAAPRLGRSPQDLPSLVEVCTALGIENTEEHTALGDARATARCFAALDDAYRLVEL